MKNWYKASDSAAAAADIVSGTVVVTLNIQVAGYVPLLKQPINRTGSTYVTLEPLPPNRKTYHGVPMLRASASASTGEDDEISDHEGDDGAGEAEPEEDDPIRAWRRMLSRAKRAGATTRLQLELFVDKGIGGTKLIKLRSLLQVHNSTRIPIVVRACPASSGALVEKMLSRPLSMGGATAGTTASASTAGDNIVADPARDVDTAVAKLTSAMYRAAGEAVARKRKALLRRLGGSAAGGSAGSGLAASAAAVDDDASGGMGGGLTSQRSFFLYSSAKAALPPAVAGAVSSDNALPADFNLSCWDAGESKSCGGLCCTGCLPVHLSHSMCIVACLPVQPPLECPLTECCLRASPGASPCRLPRAALGCTCAQRSNCRCCLLAFTSAAWRLTATMPA